jgi:hypothetical protein
MTYTSKNFRLKSIKEQKTRKSKRNHHQNLRLASDSRNFQMKRNRWFGAQRSTIAVSQFPMLYRRAIWICRDSWRLEVLASAFWRIERENEKWNPKNVNWELERLSSSSLSHYSVISLQKTIQLRMKLKCSLGAQNLLYIVCWHLVILYTSHRPFLPLHLASAWFKRKNKERVEKREFEERWPISLAWFADK